MYGIVIHAPHDLRIDEIAEPIAGPNDVIVSISSGGICGSDLHYFHDGGFGTVRIKEPMALGHEIAGVISSVGANVKHLSANTRVAVNPSRACGHCRYCAAGQPRHCLDMRFMGSAMRFPHMQGGFRQSIAVSAEQALPIPAMTSLAEAAMAEPLAVCLHAANRAGPLLGAKVLVTGCGPIGILTIMAARLAGAAEIVATDLSAYTLSFAESAGANAALNVAAKPDALSAYARDKGHFDVMFEASGSAAALRHAFEAMRPGAVIVQVGMGGDVTLPIGTLVAKEFELRGTFRFDREFQMAVDLISTKRVDVKQLITSTVSYKDAVSAFNLASDRSKAMKVQVAFDV